MGIAWLCGNCATLYQLLGFPTVTSSFAIKLIDESGGTARLEQFRYLVLYVSRKTELHDGGWWLEYQQWQGNYSFSKRGNQHWNPNIITANLDRKLFGRRAKLPAPFHIVAI